jgi:hypothetical protein
LIRKAAALARVLPFKKTKKKRKKQKRKKNILWQRLTRL